MLSDQANGSFRRMQRGGLGNLGLGGMQQAGLFARTAPITRQTNTNRAVNSHANRGRIPREGFPPLPPRMPHAPLPGFPYIDPVPPPQTHQGGPGFPFIDDPGHQQPVGPPPVNAPGYPPRQPPQLGGGLGVAPPPQPTDDAQAQLAQLGMMLMAQRKPRY